MYFSDIFQACSIIIPENISSGLDTHYEGQKKNEFFLRMLTQDEITELFQYMSSIDVYRDIFPLWTDNNSNYIGLFYDGPLKYRVCYINHEEMDISPGFRSVDSFVAEIEKNFQLDWDELEKDYPRDKEHNNNEYMDHDLSSIQLLNQRLESSELDDELRCQYIFCIMALTPYNQLDTLLKYLDDEDMYVQERACETFGFHRYAPAQEKLKDVLLHGQHNGRLAAKRALAQM